MKTSARFRLILCGPVLLGSLLFSSTNALAVGPEDGQPTGHRFFDKKNLLLFGENAAAQTAALIAIQSHGAHMESRGRTWDPYEKHFESYGYGWGAAYRYGGGVGIDMGVTYLLHATGHHKLERWVPRIGIAYGAASAGYAAAGSRQGAGGW